MNYKIKMRIAFIQARSQEVIESALFTRQVEKVKYFVNANGWDEETLLTRQQSQYDLIDTHLSAFLAALHKEREMMREVKSMGLTELDLIPDYMLELKMKKTLLQGRLHRTGRRRRDAQDIQRQIDAIDKKWKPLHALSEMNFIQHLSRERETISQAQAKIVLAARMIQVYDEVLGSTIVGKILRFLQKIGRKVDNFFKNMMAPTGNNFL